MISIVNENKKGHIYEKHIQNKICQLIENHFGDCVVNIQKNKIFRNNFGKTYEKFEVDLCSELKSDYKRCTFIWEITTSNNNKYLETLQERIKRIRRNKRLKDSIVILVVPNNAVKKARRRYKMIDLIFSTRDVRFFILDNLKKLLRDEKLLFYKDVNLLRETFNEKIGQLNIYRWKDNNCLLHPSDSCHKYKSKLVRMMFLDYYIDDIYEHRSMYDYFPTKELIPITPQDAFSWLIRKRLKTKKKQKYI